MENQSVPFQEVCPFIGEMKIKTEEMRREENSPLPSIAYRHPRHSQSFMYSRDRVPQPPPPLRFASTGERPCRRDRFADSDRGQVIPPRPRPESGAATLPKRKQHPPPKKNPKQPPENSIDSAALIFFRHVKSRRRRAFIRPERPGRYRSLIHFIIHFVEFPLLLLFLDSYCLART